MRLNPAAFRSIVRRPGTSLVPSDAPVQPAPLMGLATSTAVGQGLQQAIRGPVLTPGHAGFVEAAHVFKPPLRSVRLLAVARPLDARDVRDAIRFTVAQSVRVRARSGGHSYAGYSTLSDGAVLDLRNLRSVRVDKLNGTATVGAGPTH